mgnify:CR=1 FL=1
MLSIHSVTSFSQEDIDKADAVLSFTHPRGTMTTGGGRHVEFGYALAKGKKVALIGERENIFHDHPSVEVFSNINNWMAAYGYK